MKLLSQPFLFLLFSLIFSLSASSQIVLIMEKRSSVKTKRYYEGDEITYKLKGEDIWETSFIERLIPEENIIVLDRFYLKLEDIEAFRKKRGRRRAIAYSSSLYTFGTAWVAFTAIEDLAIRERPSDWEAAAYVGGSSFVIGTLFRTVYKNKVYRFNKKRRLRILNLTP